MRWTWRCPSPPTPRPRATRASPCCRCSRTRWTWRCRGHRLAGAPGLRLADLSAEPWIFGGSGPWSEITTAACEAAGFVPEQAHSASGWTAILAMVEAGMGIALIPRMASAERQSRDGVVLRVLEADLPRRHVVAAVRQGAAQGPAVARVLAALCEAAQPFSHP